MLEAGGLWGGFRKNERYFGKVSEAHKNKLLTALDGHDSDAIFQASRDLGKAAEALKSIDMSERNSNLRPLVSEFDKLMQASIYRLRFLRDHSETRLQLLAGWHNEKPMVYSNRMMNR